jgi:hypothetical protein
MPNFRIPDSITSSAYAWTNMLAVLKKWRKQGFGQDIDLAYEISEVAYVLGKGNLDNAGKLPGAFGKIFGNGFLVALLGAGAYFAIPKPRPASPASTAISMQSTATVSKPSAPVQKISAVQSRSTILPNGKVSIVPVSLIQVSQSGKKSPIVIALSQKTPTLSYTSALRLNLATVPLDGSFSTHDENLLKVRN